MEDLTSHSDQADEIGDGHQGAEDIGQVPDGVGRHKTSDKEQKEKGWDFVFLGANIDAPEMAEKLGVGRAFASNYHADSLGTFSNYDTLEKTVRKVRRGLKLEEKDLDDIRRDYRRRR